MQIPWHKDKQTGNDAAGAKDIRADTNIYNVVFCHEPRRFELQYDHMSHCDFSHKLGNGDMVMLTALGNRLMKHRVPKERGWKGVRYSVVMRSIRERAFYPDGFDFMPPGLPVGDTLDDEPLIYRKKRMQLTKKPVAF